MTESYSALQAEVEALRVRHGAPKHHCTRLDAEACFAISPICIYHSD